MVLPADVTLPPDLLDMLPAELDAALLEHFRARGQGAFRVRQARAWLYERDVVSFDEMTDLPVAERKALKEAFRIDAPALATTSLSTCPPSASSTRWACR